MAPSHTVLLRRLPAAEGLLDGQLAVACSTAGVQAALVSVAAHEGKAEQLPGLRLAALAPLPAHATVRCLVLLQRIGSDRSVPVGVDVERCGRSAEVWEIFMHSLPSIPLAAPVGGSAAATHALPPLECGDAGRGPGMPQHLACYCWGAGSSAWGSSCQVRVSPAELDVHPGQQERLQLSWHPAAPGCWQALLTVVDVAAGRPAYMALLRLDASKPHISRCWLGMCTGYGRCIRCR